MELQKIIEGKTFPEIKNLLTQDYKLVVKEDPDLPNLYLVTGKRGMEEFYQEIAKDSPFIEECRGIILEKESNRVVSMAFRHRLEFDYEDADIDLAKYGLEWNHVQIEKSVEGTQLRLYYYDGKWRVSTCRCLDAGKAHWQSNKSFYDLFQEAVKEEQFDLTKLSHDFCHVLILQHPENQIVVSYQKPSLVHLTSRDLSQQGYPEVDYDLGLNLPAIIYNSYSDFSTFLEKLNDESDLSKEGYILKDLRSEKRLKIMTPYYREAKELRGNVTPNNLIYHYLELKQENNVKRYLEIFPKEGYSFRKLENKLDDMVSHIHRQYCDKFVNKTLKMKDLIFCFRPFIYEINGFYLANRSKKMTKKRVSEFLSKKEPAQIAYMYHSYYDIKQ